MGVRATVCATVGALLVSGCGGSTPASSPTAESPAASDAPPAPSGEAAPQPSPTLESSPTPQTSPRPGRGTVVTTAASAYGPMLFDGGRQAIYLFDKETTSRPECYGECATAWPPVLTAGRAQARGDAQDGLLGTVRRRDGTTQVTYAGHPLYSYAHEGRGQVLCHDVVGYGGRWLVVTPEGTPAD